MERINLVLTAGLNSHSTLKMPEVSTPHVRVIIMCVLITGKRDIKALQVKCSNVDRECKWVGTVGTLEAHMVTCEFTLFFCPKECKDDENKIAHFMRKDLHNHLENDCPNRDHKCEYCGEKGTYAHITQVHDDTCEKKIVPCPNAGCTKTIQRKKVKRHLAKCVYSEIPCKYQRLGCDVKMMRRDMPAHEEDDKLHLHMALDKVINMEEEITTMKQQIVTMKQQREDDATKVLRNGASLTFELTGFAKKKDDNKFSSSTFYSSPKGYHMRIDVYANGNGTGMGTHLSIYVRILKGKYDDKINWPLVGKVTCEILNQLEDNNHFIRIIQMNQEDNTLVKKCWGYYKTCPHAELSHDPVMNTQYLKDDTLYFRVSVDIPDHKPWLECTTK